MWILLRYPFLWFLIGLVAAGLLSLIGAAFAKNRWKRIMVCSVYACGGGLLSLFGFPLIKGAEIFWADSITGVLINLGFNSARVFWGIFALGFLSGVILTGMAAGAWWGWWTTRD